MQERHLRVVMGLIALATVIVGHAFAMRLGELQAVPGVPPPYIFRLVIHSGAEDDAESPAVAVRRPHTALSLVRENVLDLHLPSLMDVELEVSSGGQTLNRLVLQSELQAARSRMEATTAWNRFLTGKAQHLPRAQLAALLETAYQAHRTWAQVDAVAQPGLARVAQERQRFHMTPVLQANVVPEELPAPRGLFAEGSLAASEMTWSTRGEAVEHEMRTIREEMSKLVAGVAPWGGIATATWSPPEGAVGGWLGLFLVGGGLLGATSLLTSCLLQRRLSKQAAQRSRVLRAMERRAPMLLRRRPPELATAARFWEPREDIALRQSTTMVRRVRVSRRIHLQPLLRRQERTQSSPMHATPPTLGGPPSRAHTPSALIDALEHLRADLLNLQRLSSAASSSEPSTPHPGSHHA